MDQLIDGEHALEIRLSRPLTKLEKMYLIEAAGDCLADTSGSKVLRIKPLDSSSRLSLIDIVRLINDSAADEAAVRLKRYEDDAKELRSQMWQLGEALDFTVL